jgi:hypothetical protein
MPAVQLQPVRYNSACHLQVPTNWSRPTSQPSPIKAGTTFFFYQSHSVRV